MPLAAKFMWWAQNTASSICLTSFIIYECFIHGNANHTRLSEVAYATNFTIVLLDILFISRVPFLIVHVVWSLLFGGIYAFVITPIFYFSLPPEYRNRYVYSALDWDNAADAIGNIFLFGVLHVTIYTITATLQRIRTMCVSPYGNSMVPTRMIQVVEPVKRSAAPSVAADAPVIERTYEYAVRETSSSSQNVEMTKFTPKNPSKLGAKRIPTDIHELDMSLTSE